MTTEQEINSKLDLVKKYRAQFLGISDPERQTFKGSKCTMGISVGQRYHEGGKFGSSIKLVNKYFGGCNILVADTLQRHTLRIEQEDKNEEEIYALAKKAGDYWIDRSMQYISTFTIPYTISRWDEWLANDQYYVRQKQVYNLYKNNNEYKNAVDQIANQFLLTRNHFVIKDRELAFDLCLRYLLEEAAVVCILVELGYKLTVYPTGGNLAITMAHTKLVQNEHGLGAKTLELRFRSN